MTIRPSPAAASAPAGIASVAICVCSYERPASLARCLASLERLDTPSLADAQVRVVVVDNSPRRSAEATVAARAAHSRFAMSYVSEPAKGLSRARNAALDAALAPGADALAFLDDDEIASPAWLAGLLDALARGAADAAVGPVHPIFEGAPPVWAIRGGFFADTDPDGADDAREGRTNNVMLRLAPVRATGLRFDPAYDELGGEDTAFFRALAAHGSRIAVAPDAIVHEWVPASRVRVAWLARRWFRTGGVEARSRPHRSARGRAANAGRGLARIGAGGALALVSACAGGWRDPSRIVRRVFTLARGGGLLASAFGVHHREYAAPRIEERRP